MISAVLDTNVLASGTVSAYNPPGQFLNAWRLGEFELVTSEHIISELYHTFQKPYFLKHIRSDELAGFIDLLQNEAIVSPITVKVTGIATHTEDDMTLATAISAQADYLVTGDCTFLQKVGHSYQKVKLINPNDFLNILKQQT